MPKLVKRYDYHGELLTVREIVERSGLSKSTVRRKIAQGGVIEDRPDEGYVDADKREVMRRYGYRV